MDTQEIVRPYVQRNAYFAHPSILLCSMLESKEEDVRRSAVNTVRLSRSKPAKPPRKKVLKGIRQFKIPTLEWDAEHWWAIINWADVAIAEPKILQNLTEEDLEKAITVPHEFPAFPCHSQSVERAVKLVTEVVCKVEGGDRQQGEILSIMACRKARKPFKTKREYKYTVEP